MLIGLAGAAAGCVRPDKSPSPFEELRQATESAGAVGESPHAGSDFVILPDSEFVYGPSLRDFSISEFVSKQAGTLADYSEMVEDMPRSGSEILEKISRDYSISPRLLLALLRERSQQELRLDDAFIADDPSFKGLYRQLSWAANQLNRGYYTCRVGALHGLTLTDGSEITLSDLINCATAALQYLYSLLLGYEEWQRAVGPLGLYAESLACFGDSQQRAIDALIPNDLDIPEMHLPYGAGEGWYFTSGPHSAWGDGAAWAALDFAPELPDEDSYGCYESSAWVRAVADGQVVRSGEGLLVQDLDGDGFEGSGWAINYMHIAEEGRAKLGSWLRAGEPLGHPSCEGGPATGTHVHLTRRFNGEWIPADQELPFILDGWVSKGFGVEYDGSLVRDGIEVQASGFPTDENRVYP